LPRSAWPSRSCRGPPPARLRVHIGSLIRLGDRAYGSSGDFGPAFITAVDMRDGRIVWQDRSFSRAQLVSVGGAGGLLVVLDEDGVLGLARIGATGLQVLARAQVASRLSWTPPTLAGGTLYVRDRATLHALRVAR
jgi:hypothetical protein